jgi:hypothetical protein
MSEDQPIKSLPIDYPQPEGDMEIYDAFKWPDSVPKKPFSELTSAQKKLVLDSYRFSGFRPGTYQGVTYAGNGTF